MTNNKKALNKIKYKQTHEVDFQPPKKNKEKKCEVNS